MSLQPGSYGHQAFRLPAFRSSRTVHRRSPGSVAIEEFPGPGSIARGDRRDLTARPLRDRRTRLVLDGVAGPTAS